MNFPKAAKKPHKLTAHQHTRVDDYYWMREKENPDLIAYLEAENNYADSILKPTEPLQQLLFQEMKGRIKEDDSSAPYFKNGYWYYVRYAEGLEYAFYCRKKGNLKATEEILLDENSEAKKHPYYEIVAYAVTKNNKMLAFAEDLSGGTQNQIRFKNLETGEILPHTIENTGTDLAWNNDNETLYFSQKDAKTLRPYRIVSLNIHSGIETMLYEEKDDTFVVGVNRTGDLNHIFIGSYSTLTTEFRFKSANDHEDFNVFLRRQEGHEYYLESSKDSFFIKTNQDAKNFKLASSSKDDRSPDHWKIIQAHNPTVLIEDFEVFETHLVVQEKENGLSQIRVYDRASYQSKLIPPTEETYTLYLDSTPDETSQTFRIGYSSMTTPQSVLDINLTTFERKLIKQTEILGDFKAQDYRSERIWSTAEDGTKIPTSLVYKKDLFKKDGSNPILVYAYGAYGSTVDAYFSSARLSLLDRGFVFAIAHVRGSEYLGTEWYEQGKLLHKKNTFADFIATTEELIRSGYADATKIFAMGGSAGGLLMAVVANMRPDLWKGIVCQVPFVDVVSTMLDETIPLTTGEYDEWGNPHEKEYYDLMLSYSPYDQIEAKAYPPMLITSGINDSQVQYWEPTKYVAKLRELKTNNSLLILKTNMDAGHEGASGRFEQLKEVAEEYAFLLLINKTLT